MVADYGEFKSADDARRAHDGLVARINAATIRCCSMVALDPVVSDELWNHSWVPFMPPAGYEKMVIEVQTIRIPTFDDKFERHDVWSLSLRVYRL